LKKLGHQCHRLHRSSEAKQAVSSWHSKHQGQNNSTFEQCPLADSFCCCLVSSQPWGVHARAITPLPRWRRDLRGPTPYF